MVSPEIDWRGIPQPDGAGPRCMGRAEAMERMRVGLLAGGRVSASTFVEDGDRVLAHVHHVDDDFDEDGSPRAERFVVAEVRDGQITEMQGFATEPEALDALHASHCRTRFWESSVSRGARHEW